MKLKEMIFTGLCDGTVNIINNPDDGLIACQIGKKYFCFLKNTYHEKSLTVDEVYETYTKDQLTDMIYAQLLQEGTDDFTAATSFLHEVYNKENLLLWNMLKEHIGHNVQIVAYGDPDDPADICLECKDCDEVILDAELYTLQARSEENEDFEEEPDEETAPGNDGEIRLKDIPVGGKFSTEIGNFIVLEQKDNGRTAVITENLYGNKVQFSSDSTEYLGSELANVFEDKIYPEFARVFGQKNLCSAPVRLITMDENAKTGVLHTKVRPLSHEESKKYRDLLIHDESLDDGSFLETECYWTCTAWNNKAEDKAVAAVAFEGFSVLIPCYKECGARPFCILNSDIYVTPAYKVKVKYTDNTGCNDSVSSYFTKEEAINAIDKELDNEKEERFCGKNYDYADCGDKTEIWDKDGDDYACWEIIEEK